MTLETDSTVVEPFELELTTPLSTAAGDVTRRRGFLVGVEGRIDGESVRGVGEAAPLPPWTESYEDCEAALADADSSEDVPEECSAARHGLELAELDALARAEGRPLAELLIDRVGLDGPPLEDVAANAVVGDAGLEATVDAAAAAADAGFEVVKLKAGSRPLPEDVERVQAVDEAVDARLRVDVNGAWDEDSIVDGLRGLQGLDIEFIEQPLPADNLVGLGALRGYGAVVAVDETLAQKDLERILSAGAADVGIWKPMVHGGPEATASAADYARDRGLTPVVTTTVDGAVARTAAVHVAAAVGSSPACGLATGSFLREDFGVDPVPVEDGHISVPTDPGLAGEAFDGLLWE